MASVEPRTIIGALPLDSEVRQVFGRDVQFVNLETLIHLERAAGHPKDLERTAELEAIANEWLKASGDFI